MSPAAERIRCYNCGRLGQRAAAACTKCVASFRALCPCGTELSVFDDACPSCHADHVPRRLRTSRHPYVRAAKWTTLALASGLAAWIAFGPRPVPAWKLKTEAAEAFNAHDFETAAIKARAATLQNPSDAKAWYLLAASYQALGYDAGACISTAEEAIKVSPTHLEARTFLAGAEAERGHLDRAIEHAEAAARGNKDDGRTWELLANLELRKPQPNLARVQDALDRARATGRDTLAVKVLLADVSIRLNGVLGGGADRLPTRVATTLRTALSALESIPENDAEYAAVAMSRARIQLALGRPDDAYTSADGALARLPAGAARGTECELRLLKAMALHARGSRPAAMEEFARVLHDRPDAATASTASSYLANADDAASARALLANAAEAGDPQGAIRAVLAVLLLTQNAPEDAARAIESARAAAPGEAFFAEIAGSVKLAQGRFADARAAFDDAIRLAPELVSPRVRRALVDLAELGSAKDGPAALARATGDLEQIRQKYGENAFLLTGLGRLKLAAGDTAGAVDALGRATVQSPADADAWLVLADALRRTGEEQAPEKAAAALGRARSLRPRDPDVALAEARAWLAAGKPDVAASACTEFLRRAPSDAAILRERARAYRALEMWSLAAADYARIRELAAADAPDPDAADHVDCLYRSGDPESARRVAERARAGAPPGQSQYLEVLTAIHSRDPEHSIAQLRRGPPNPILAQLDLAAGRTEEAIAALRAIVRVAPPDPTAVVLLVAAILGPEPVSEECLSEARTLEGLVAAGAPAGVRELVEGRILLAQKRFADAVAPLRISVAASPADPLAALFLGEALFRSGGRPESLTLFRRAAGESGPFVMIRRVVAQRLLEVSAQTKDFDRAEALATEALRIDPTFVPAGARAVVLLHGRGAFAQAADVAERLMRLPGLTEDEAANLRLAAAQERFFAGNFQSVETHIESLPARLQSSPDARLFRAFAELGAGRLADAQTLFESVRADDPSSAPAAVGLAQTALRRGDRRGAAAVLDAWCAAHADDRDIALAASRMFQREGMTDDAVRFATTCAERNPNDMTAAANYAAILRHAGRDAEALASLRRFAAAAPPDRALDARLVAARLAVRCRIDLEATLRDVGGVAEDESIPAPARAEAATIAAEALLELRRPAEAESAAAAVLDRLASQPSRGWTERSVESRARFVVGFAAETGTPPRHAFAIDNFLRCIELDPDNLDAINNLAQILAQNPATAVRALEQARPLTSRSPGNAVYWDTRGEAARRAGEPGEAETSWRRALELLAASPRPDPSRTARTALRLGELLRERKRDVEARAVVDGARAGVVDPELQRRIAAFLAE